MFTSLVQSFVQAYQLPEVVRVRMFKELPAMPQIKNAKISVLNDYAWSATGSRLSFQGKKLSTQNVILKNGSAFEIISVFGFSNYLAGVVASEMPVSWPMEALKAQAVVARSFTVAKLNGKARVSFGGEKPGRGRYFDMESDVSDQMFSVTESQKAIMAVLDTEGVLLEDGRGRALKAYYHSDCGGETVKARDVWGGGTEKSAEAIDSGTARDPWCASRPTSRWSFEVDKSEFYKKLGLREGIAYTAKIDWAGRSQFFSILGETFSVQKLRQTFGFSNLKSTPSEVVFGEKTVRFTGQGFGHGAGLCQWGSRSQALSGISYRAIVSHYYPQAVLTHAKPRIASVLQSKKPLFAANFSVSR